MKRHLSQILLAALALATPVFASTDAPVPPHAFGPGEQISWDVSVLGMHAGKAQISVGSMMKVDGKDVWPVVCLGQTQSLAAVYPVKDKFISYWDPMKQRSTGWDFYADEGRVRRREKVRFNDDGSIAHAFKQREGTTGYEGDYELPQRTVDLAAASFQVRNQKLSVGNTFEIPVFTGISHFNLKAKVVGQQKLSTKLGEKDVFKVTASTAFDGKLKADREVVLYFTADAYQVPVRIEADFALGRMVAEVTQHLPGRGGLQ